MDKQKGQVLVAGVNGFVGQHLVSALAEAEYRVVGIGQDVAAFDSVSKKLEAYFTCDLTDPESIKKLSLDGITAVINLAGLADVGKSYDQKELYMKLNSDVHTRLYDRFVQLGLSPKVLAISSGSVYDPNQLMPIAEDGRLHSIDSTNPYTASKITMEQQLEKYKNTSLECVIVRPFNHTGPSQRTGFIVPDLAREIVGAKNTNSAINVGNLNTKRDYTDVRDVAKAYVSLVEAPELNHSVYNVCSGRSLPGSFILKRLMQEFDASNLEIKIDESKIRPNDIEDIYGNNKRLQEDTGWSPETPIEQTLSDFSKQYLSENQASQQMVA